MSTTNIQIAPGSTVVDIVVPAEASVFQLIGVGIRVSDPSEMRIRMSFDGSSFIANAEMYSADINGAAVTSDNIPIVQSMAGNIAAPVIPILLNYYLSLGSATIRPGIDGCGAAHDGARWNRTLSSGQCKVSGRVMAVRLYLSSGTFTAGNILAVSV